MKKTDFLVILFFILASLFTLKDLFLPGFYTSHDGPHQIVRAYYYHELLSEKQLPPRWVAGLNFGFGYPLFIFSYHLPWLIAEPFRLLGLDVFSAVKMTFLLGFILSGIFMYFFQKSLFGRLPAFTGSLIYLYAPFRFSNIYVRAAIGDATAFIFAPLLFWSFTKLSEKISFSGSVLVSLSLTALLLSHAMVAFFYLLAFLIYAVYCLFFVKNRLKLAIYTCLSFILFIFYSSYYLLPSFLERPFTKFNATLGSVSSNLNFVPISKLIYSPWGYGTVDAPEGAMSLAIGIAQILVVLFALILVFFKFWKRTSKQKKIMVQGIFFLSLFIFSVYLMTPVSKAFWLILSKYLVIDFNWRILNLTVFASSLIAGWLIFSFNRRRLFRASLAFIILLTAFYTNRNHLRINQTLNWTVPFFLKLEKTTNSYDEYMPKWADNSRIKENAPRFIPNDDVSVSLFKQKNHLIEFNAQVHKDSEFTLNSLYYPGWTLWDNGQEKQINEGSGLIRLFLKKGTHKISVRFEKTPLRAVSDLISLSSIILTAGYFLYRMISPRG